ncbi:HupE/UreJ family protein [Paracoccus shanxieyensis]|uniref:Urease accessory protein n=1 Tax=Paracoccus shanxieyensis TaxID=2675752 RepID=A0A6L6IXK9_9RHOB|nr:HupE/UreJ family protein [Paracoccus shanxieyensis]MTH64953.1 urease accessory protein [Paracoccus shanxieyensis]MTH88143.1 urease accessory protein [Paracoccus shanxieyensis]
MKRILPFLLFPTAALAHPGHHSHGAPFNEGWMHPLGGADHVLAMVAVGLWAATASDKRGLWALPLTFVVAMVAGGAMGAAGIHLPGVEPVILASGIILGLAVALALRPSLGFALPVVALFGIMHGHAHGAEGPAQGLLAYGAGFVLATSALHLAGIGLGRLGMARVLGGLTAAAGVALTVMP